MKEKDSSKKPLKLIRIIGWTICISWPFLAFAWMEAGHGLKMSFINDEGKNVSEGIFGSGLAISAFGPLIGVAVAYLTTIKLRRQILIFLVGLLTWLVFMAFGVSLMFFGVS